MRVQLHGAWGFLIPIQLQVGKLVSSRKDAATAA